MNFINVLLRADAGPSQGTGHIMRCLTLAQALTARQHTVTLLADIGGIRWLTEAIEQSGIQHIDARAGVLDFERVSRFAFDWVVIDSYSIPSEQISQLNESLPCLAIVDGDTRSIRADLYLDQNLGTKLAEDGEVESQLLAGTRYALVRDAVLEHRRSPSAPPNSKRLRVVAFMGGTDPLGAIVAVTESIVAEQLDIDLDLVAPGATVARVRASVAQLSQVRVIEPTAELPAILGRADIIVSAAGTSAWDICAMARPSVLVGLVDNQRESLEAIGQAGLAMTIDATQAAAGSLSQVGQLVASLVNNEKLRQDLSQRCWDTVDGLGKVRVVEKMEGTRRR